MGCLQSKKKQAEEGEERQDAHGTDSQAYKVPSNREMDRLRPGGEVLPPPRPGLAKQGRAPSNYAQVHAKVMRERLQEGSGLVGLQNLGNTCFMNTSMQCLSNTICLTDYFLGYDWVSEINDDNPLGYRGGLARSFCRVLEQMWSNKGGRALSPTEFKQQVARCNPMFEGYDQQDAQELLVFLLDGLHEDLNRVKSLTSLHFSPHPTEHLVPCDSGQA
mmetsp:Transcript_12708/g.27281  ORF Transcript_12708/g.27281 Transcript_12708/m.27281 type:complete len:218 (+) Transcript_12708:3-656(+)